MSDVFYRPLIEEMVWSYTRIECWNDCPYQFFMRYIKRIAEKPMFYATFGSYLHKLIERYYNGAVDKESLLSAFYAGYAENVQGERPSEQIAAKYITQGADYFRAFEPFPYLSLGVEREIHFSVAERPFVGIVDFIGERNGELVIVDHKSRDLKPRSGRAKPTAKDKELDGMLRQLYLYAEGIRQEIGRFPDYLCFNCFRTGAFIKEPFDPAEHEETLRWVGKQIAEIEDSEEFPPSVDYFKCRYLCGLNDQCIFYEMR